MARSGLTINHSEIQSYLDGEHGIGEMLDGLAQDVLHAAYSGAPEVTGEYKDNLHIETVHTDRMVKRVVADVEYALVVEANHGTLSRALDAAK